MEDDTRAIIVGVGRITRRGGGFSLVEMISSAADAALLDASSSSSSSSSAAAAALLASIDCVAVPGTFSSPSAGHLELDAALPGAVAARCGIANAPATRLLTSGCSGNAPQAFVSTLSAEIERGALRSALIAGGEALHSIHRGTVDASAWESEAQAAASGCGFGEAEACFGGGTDALFDMWSDLEQATGLGAITSCYALFETALRARCGRTLPEHARAMATFCAGLSDVAAAGAPHSWFDQVREPDELLGRDGAATKNRWVALPLRKMMCSMQSVDQSAALVLTSVGEARRLGIDASRWVYVRSGATVEEPRTLSHRPLDALHGSPAARTAFARALALASIHDRGPAVSALDAVDLYACFPVSAAIAARELGLDFDWRRDDGAKVSLLGVSFILFSMIWLGPRPGTVYGIPRTRMVTDICPWHWFYEFCFCVCMMIIFLGYDVPRRPRRQHGDAQHRGDGGAAARFPRRRDVARPCLRDGRRPLEALVRRLLARSSAARRAPLYGAQRNLGVQR